MVLPCVTLALFALTPVLSTASSCDAPSPAFLLPDLSHHRNAAALNATSSRVSDLLNNIMSDTKYGTTHFSIEVTSQQAPLFDAFHTAEERSTVHRGARTITNATNYRIASMTKPFTVLALLQLAQQDKLNLDDSILKHIPALDHEEGKGTGGLPWKDVTIRSLATQNSGIPRDLAQSDIVIDPKTSHEYGLPDASEIHDMNLPTCDSMVNYTRACNATDLLGWVDQLPPVFAPHQKSSYSNVNFDLLGLAIANVSGMSFENYIQKHILDKVGMHGSSFSTPPDEVAAIPKDEEQYWPFKIGVQNPTGGMYSNAGDMGRWIRYVLSVYNSVGLNWFDPASWSGSMDTYYGMPWEIFRARTRDILEDETASSRPVTFVTKGGGLPGYSSLTIIIPEYGLGAVILVAGHGDLLGRIREVVVREFVRFADQVAMQELKRYTGVYVGNEGDRMVIKMDRNGLVVDEFLSRGKDVRQKLSSQFARDGATLVLPVVPTLLYADEQKQEGERWRVLLHSTGQKKSSMWDNYCVTNIEGPGYFAGKPLNEIVFWRGKTVDLELTGYRKTWKKTAGVGDTIRDRLNLEL